MPEKTITTFISNTLDPEADAGKPTMIEVKDVDMVFNIASETLNNLKEYAIALARRELTFKPFYALQGINVELKKGDVFGILGTNGSGKSTLLKIIAGVLEPTNGTCTINGTIAPLIELGAGFDQDLTARENVYLNGALLGYSKKFIDDHFDEIVDFAEVSAFLDMPIKNFSSGMVARIAFAIATAVIPDILIVDEVLSVGDFMFQQKCERRINTLINEHQTTVLIVSHSTDQIERLCNKAVWIEKGHMRMAGPAKEVCDTYRMIGGHIGSPESEEKVMGLARANIAVPSGLIDTIALENRYEIGAELCSRLPQDMQETIVLAPAEQVSYCLVANSLAGALNAGVLLTEWNQLPDATKNRLLCNPPRTVYVVGSEAQVNQGAIGQLAGACPETEIIRIDGSAPHLVCQEAFCCPQASWGDTALLTYPECTGDMLSFMPYTYRTHIPLFFSTSEDEISEQTAAALKQFKRLLVLGGPEKFSEEFVQKLEAEGCETVRFCGKDAYDANRIINDWICEQDPSFIETGMTLLLSSFWFPNETLCAAPYAHSTNSLIMLEDAQSMDSVSHSIDYLQQRAEHVNKLVFLGSNTYTPYDKTLLGKALGESR